MLLYFTLFAFYDFVHIHILFVEEKRKITLASVGILLVVQNMVWFLSVRYRSDGNVCIVLLTRHGMLIMTHRICLLAQFHLEIIAWLPADEIVMSTCMAERASESSNQLASAASRVLQ